MKIHHMKSGPNFCLFWYTKARCCISLTYIGGYTCFQSGMLTRQLILLSGPRWYHQGWLFLVLDMSIFFCQCCGFLKFPSIKLVLAALFFAAWFWAFSIPNLVASSISYWRQRSLTKSAVTKFCQYEQPQQYWSWGQFKHPWYAHANRLRHWSQGHIHRAWTFQLLIAWPLSNSGISSW